MPMRQIDVTIKGIDTDFAAARKVALSLAGQLEEEPALVAWHDGPHARIAPRIEGADLSTRWRDYGESHGGDVAISINGDFDFIFADAARYESMEDSKSPYISVKDAEGNDYLCLVSALRDPTNPREEACSRLGEPGAYS